MSEVRIYSAHTFNVVLVSEPDIDDQTLYLDGQRVVMRENIDEHVVIALIEKMGYDVDYTHKTITEACAEKYEGDYLPDNINELEFE